MRVGGFTRRVHIDPSDKLPSGVVAVIATPRLKGISIIASNINLNPPVAAAFSMVPIAFVVMYLMVARRTGSLERM